MLKEEFHWPLAHNSWHADPGSAENTAAGGEAAAAAAAAGAETGVAAVGWWSAGEWEAWGHSLVAAMVEQLEFGLLLEMKMITPEWLPHHQKYTGIPTQNTLINLEFH